MASLALLLVLPLLSGCTSKEQKAADLQSSYYDAVCRLYSDETCVQNMSDTCGMSLSFDTPADCVGFLTFAQAQSGCDVASVLADNEDLVNACLDQIDAWDCNSQDQCDDQGNYMPDQGDCAALSAAIDLACPSDTGA